MILLPKEIRVSYDHLGLYRRRKQWMQLLDLVYEALARP